MIFQQEIWNRFNQLGGHFRIDTATGHAQRLNAVEAIQRFQQARREVIMTHIEVNAATVIQVDRRRTLTEQKNVLAKRRADIGATGKARNDEKEVHTKAIELAKELNEGKDGKDGLKKYAEGWKGPAPESVESRLGSIAKTRKEVYTKIATIISWGRPVEEISEVEIQAAIDELQKNRLGKGTKPKVGTLEHRKRALAALIAVEPAQKPTGGKGKGGGDIMGENPELARLKGEYQSVDDEIKKVTAQIEELESLQLNLKNERARYEPNNEHGKAYAENLRKMEDSYKKLEVAAASRVPPLTPADVQDFLLVYPTGSYSVPMAGGPPVPRGGILGLMTTLANEAAPPLWDKDGNALHENEMTVMYAVAYARAQQQIKGVGGSLTAQGGAIYDATSTATIEAFFDAGVASGKFNEMTLLASNATELAKVGTLTLAGGATVNMASGDNDTLRAYARGRFDIYTKAIQELIEEHDKSIQVAEKKGEEIDKKYEVQEARYAALETLISQEEATEESRKISAQVYRRGLTEGESVKRLTNIAPLGASTAQAERDRYLDYEKNFMLKFPDFPRGMLEFLDVIFQYRTDPEGKKLLGTVYELLVDMNHSGLTEDRSPQIMLADMIYESHPSIREMLHITRDEGVAHLTSAGVTITESWDNIVLKAFRNRQIGCPITTPPDIVYKPFIQRPYSTSEMNAIFTSIQHQILQKAVNRGVLVDPSKDYNF